MSSATLPHLYVPLPPAIHPAVESLRQHTMAWARRFHLIHDHAGDERMQAIQSWTLVARCFPQAEYEALMIVVDWDTWAFLIDDQSENLRHRSDPETLAALLRSFLAVLDHHEPVVHGPLVESLSDIWERLCERTTPQWQRRFRQSVADCFDALVWEAHNRQQGRIPDMETYIRMRRKTSGFETHVNLADLTEQFRFPDQIHAMPELQALTDIANDVISWTNDLFSLPKERAERDIHNLALICQHEQQIGEQQAIDHVVALVNREVRRFFEVEAQLPDMPPEMQEDVGKYLGVLRAWMRGNLDWSMATTRYHSTVKERDCLSDNRNVILLASLAAIIWWISQRRRRKIRLVPNTQGQYIYTAFFTEATLLARKKRR